MTAVTPPSLGFCGGEAIGLCCRVMHHWRPWIAFLLALSSSAAFAAVIYKWTDADGVIHFSDQAVPGAEKIVTSGPTSRGIGGPTPRASTTATETQKNSPKGLVYADFTIDSPQPEENFTGDVAVGVHLRLAPALRDNQSITWLLNGKALSDQSPDATAFSLSGLARGSYVLSATITDQESGESINSDSVNFYLRQPSALMPQNKAK